MNVPDLPPGAKIRPRDYQWRAAFAILEYFERLSGNPLAVMPTGTGKSLVIALLCYLILKWYPTQRIMCLTHVAELIEQNAKALRALWPLAPLGIHSASLKQRDLFEPILYGGCKTIVNALARFSWVDLIFVDECHLISPNAATVYGEIIAHFRRINPKLKVIGFTATHYRQGQGLLTDASVGLEQARIFTDIAIDMTTQDWWMYFVSNGFLVPPVTRKGVLTYNMGEVGVSNGDYKLAQMNAVVDKMDTNHKVAKDTLLTMQQYARKKLLSFCAGVDHAEHIADIMSAMGVPTYAVHSRVQPERRTELITAFHTGEIRSLTNNNILTTGFDDPPIDIIGMCRPTTSTSLWVQMLGRGTRPSPGKRDCLVQDYAGNTARLGPINDPLLPKPPGQKGGGTAPVKICEACGCYNHASVRVCVYCGEEFPRHADITAMPGVEEIFRGEMPVIEIFPVHRVFFTKHLAKKDGKESIKITYHCGLKYFNAYLDFEAAHGYPRHLAKSWWLRFIGEPVPSFNDDALMTLQSNQYRKPDGIKVHTNTAYPEIVDYVYNSVMENVA